MSQSNQILLLSKINTQLNSQITGLKSKLHSCHTKIAILTDKNEILNHLCKDYTLQYKEIVSQNEFIQLKNKMTQQSLQQQDYINIKQLESDINVLHQTNNELRVINQILLHSNTASTEQNKSLQHKLNKTIHEMNQYKQEKNKLETLSNELNAQIQRLKADMNEQNIIIRDLQNEIEIRRYDDTKSITSTVNKLQIPRAVSCVPITYESSVNQDESAEIEYFYSINDHVSLLHSEDENDGFLLDKFRLQLIKQEQENEWNNSNIINQTNITSKWMDQFDVKSMSTNLMDMQINQENDDDRVKSMQLVLSRKACEDDIFCNGLDTMKRLFEIKCDVTGRNEYNIDTRDVTILCLDRNKNDMLNFFKSIEERYENVAIVGDESDEYLVVITTPTKLVAINVLCENK
eukprot:231898_1